MPETTPPEILPAAVAAADPAAAQRPAADAPGPPGAWHRRLPVGAEVVAGGGVHFRVWAPRRRRVEVVWGEGAVVELEREADGSGYFSGFAADAAAGDLYRLRLDGGEAFPDPASRFQPHGPHGPSRVVDAAAWRWCDDSWRGPEPRGQVLYEMHIGTWTAEGTWAAAAARLSELADLGVTMLEVMPVAEFAGRFGWGYDGVDLFAPSHLYGEPDDFRAFVERAHELGLAVILDVVYNHLGPDGNYLEQYSTEYFTDLHANDWGRAIHFYGFYGAPAVRELFTANAAHWIAEYHLDGLRLDATQDIHDRSPEHIIAAVGAAARRAAAALPPGRQVYLVAETEPQDSRLVRSRAAGGHGLDAMWSDDFHHAALVALTGRSAGYYMDYRGTPQELVAAARFGTLYQGQRSLWQEKRRGSPLGGIARAAVVSYLENHDQVANSARGERLHQLASPGCHRAMTALLLLGPSTPLLFQGQEWNTSAPFLYFADHHPELARAVRQGRREFLAQFPHLRGAAVRDALAAPEAPATFAACKLDRAERRRQTAALALHRDLLRLRREDPVFRLQGAAGVDGAVLGPAALVLRFAAPDEGVPAAPAPFAGAPATEPPPEEAPSEEAPSEESPTKESPSPTAPETAPGDRLLLLNLGADLDLRPAPEPLLAPPAGRRWQLLWSSEEPAYGGHGTPPAADGVDGGWRVPGQAAMVLRAVPGEEAAP